MSNSSIINQNKNLWSQKLVCFSTSSSSIERPIQRLIISKLTKTFQPVYLSVINESSNHSVPKGSETHFKVTIVSELFNDLKLIDRHRAVNECLIDELKTDIHSLSITARTSSQWSQNSIVEKSPNCLGGSKYDKQMKT